MTPAMTPNDTKKAEGVRGVLVSLFDTVLLFAGVMLLIPPIPSERNQPLPLFPSVLPGLIVLAIHHVLNWRRARDTWYFVIIKIACWVGIAAYLREVIRLS